MSDLNIPEAAYTAGEAAIGGCPIMVSDILNAAAPIILTTKLTEIVNRLQELSESARKGSDSGVEAGLSAAIGIIQGHMDKLATV